MTFSMDEVRTMPPLHSMDDDNDAGVGASLLNHAEQHDDHRIDETSQPSVDISTGVTRRLYTSHFLSAWNSRVFEFGAVLYLATIFPGTLLPMSVYALVRGLSAILLAPAVGKYIDSGNRLKVVRLSIISQRVAVALSCLAFYIMCLEISLGEGWKSGMLALVTALACVEKLSSIMNLVSVEKDWVVVVAGDNQDALTSMNAQMRRIDLMCKLFGPLFIALLDGFSTKAAILVNLTMNITSVVVEYFAIAQVYRDTPSLQESKRITRPHHPEEISTAASTSRLVSFWKQTTHIIRSTVSDHAHYFQHPAFLPSIAGALLYLTVLSFAGQMVTYLLSTGYSSTQVGVARTMSVLFEVSATWLAPWLIGRIGPVRAGLWMSCWQVGTLAMGMMVFLRFEEGWPLGSASGLVGGTILSRLGLFGFDLCVQVIVQEEVGPESRGMFSSVEAAWQNAFELLSFASTIIFHRPGDFKWPSILSMAAVGCASVLYSTFVHARRGHLLHLEALEKICGNGIWRKRGSDRAMDRMLSRAG